MDVMTVLYNYKNNTTCCHTKLSIRNEKKLTYKMFVLTQTICDCEIVLYIYIYVYIYIYILILVAITFLNSQ